MTKRLSLLLLFCIVGIAQYGFAEDIYITTYFPSANAAYDRLIANKVGIGTNSTPELTRDGVLSFGPRATFPGLAPRQGDIFYYGIDRSFYFFNATIWLPALGSAREIPYGPGTFSCNAPINPLGLQNATAVNVLDLNKNRADFSAPPPNGFLICI
ncbi:MAG: hypothetical protein WDL87_06010 [Candidatus Omnitrophota bacterium]|jgi:hypothetical protein